LAETASGVSTAPSVSAKDAEALRMWQRAAPASPSNADFMASISALIPIQS
jgi:hypothetical protein